MRARGRELVGDPPRLAEDQRSGLVGGLARASVRLPAIALSTAAFYAAWVVTRPLGLASAALGRRTHHAVVRAWARTMLALLGVDLRVVGRPPAAPFFLVSNHLSYLDVPVIFSALDGFFLAKSEIAGWPVMGLLARTTGTLFVDRGRKSDLLRVIGEVERVLAGGGGVMVFPEGTSSRGEGVLPFRPSLFEVAARAELPVHFAAVTYRTPKGAAPADLSVCWWGDMAFGSHFLSLLTLPRILATLTFGPSPIEGSDRKDLARLCHQAVDGVFEPVATPGARNPIA